jgi:hypothetical protein
MDLVSAPVRPENVTKMAVVDIADDARAHGRV